MTLTRDVLAVFNRGLIDRRAVARLDVTRVTLSARQQTNWMPRVLGSMSLRPGTERLGNFYSNATGIYIPFVFDNADTALIEMTDSVMRVWDDGDTLVTRNTVTATVTNGTFTSDLTGWTDADETGATSSWATGGYLELIGAGTTEAKRQQSVAITETTTEHALRIVVERGPLYIRIGTSAGEDDVFEQAVLRTGTHSIAFTPNAATIYIELASPLTYPTLVDSVAFESSGNLELPTPYAAADLPLVRSHEISDVIFLACDGYQQRRIERRSNNSWSFVLYESADGPYEGLNGDKTRLTPSAISGEITLSASRHVFQSTDVGRLYRLTSAGQNVEVDVSAENTWSDSIRVTGVGSSRTFSLTRAGTWSATVTLQRSIGEPGAWADVATYTTNGTVNYSDGLDNTEAYYRIGVDTGDYTSGTAELSMSAEFGTITGVVKVTAYTSSTSVTGVVLKALGEAAATEVWQAGAWSDTTGYPTCVTEYEGRLWWAGRGRAWASISDDFDNFNPDYEGDAAPINRAVGSRAVDVINWLIPAQRLIAGGGMAEHSIRSTSFDEFITPSNYNVKSASTQGSAKIAAVILDDRGIFVGRSKSRVYEMQFKVEKADYISGDLTALVPDLGQVGFTRLAIQRQPDTRVWGVLADGTAAVLIRDETENVMGWIKIETDGLIEDVVVLPSEVEDRVFLMVNRTINGATARFHEEMQREDQCVGGTINRQADAALHWTGSSTDTITGLDHLEGESVVVWANGKDLGSYTVASGSITISEATTEAWIGLTYQARYKSGKIAAELRAGLHLSERSRIGATGLILADVHYQGLRYGPDFDTMDELPLVDNAEATAADTVWESYDEDMVEFPGEWDTNNAICLEANAPRPCTVSAVVIRHDRQETTD